MSLPSATNKKKNKTFIIVATIIAVVLLIVIVYSYDGEEDKHDGICDQAGCTREATCEVGDMEFCVAHYYYWSKRAYESNHKND